MRNMTATKGCPDLSKAPPLADAAQVDDRQQHDGSQRQPEALCGSSEGACRREGQRRAGPRNRDRRGHSRRGKHPLQRRGSARVAEVVPSRRRRQSGSNLVPTRTVWVCRNVVGRRGAELRCSRSRRVGRVAERRMETGRGPPSPPPCVRSEGERVRREYRKRERLRDERLVGVVESRVAARRGLAWRRRNLRRVSSEVVGALGFLSVALPVADLLRSTLPRGPRLRPTFRGIFRAY